jgi:hypothetical protein
MQHNTMFSKSISPIDGIQDWEKYKIKTVLDFYEHKSKFVYKTPSYNRIIVFSRYVLQSKETLDCYMDDEVELANKYEMIHGNLYCTCVVSNGNYSKEQICANFAHCVPLEKVEFKDNIYYYMHYPGIKAKEEYIRVHSQEMVSNAVASTAFKSSSDTYFYIDQLIPILNNPNGIILKTKNVFDEANDYIKKYNETPYRGPEMRPLYYVVSIDMLSLKPYMTIMDNLYQHNKKEFYNSVLPSVINNINKCDAIHKKIKYVNDKTDPETPYGRDYSSELKDITAKLIADSTPKPASYCMQYEEQDRAIRRTLFILSTAPEILHHISGLIYITKELFSRIIYHNIILLKYINISCVLADKEEIREILEGYIEYRYKKYTWMSLEEALQYIPVQYLSVFGLRTYALNIYKANQSTLSQPKNDPMENYINDIIKEVKMQNYYT